MASTPSSSSRRHQSLFFRDLASPISSHRHGDRFSTPISSLRLDTAAAAASDPPPPPVFTLDDRLDFSPEPYLPPTPEPAPTLERNYQSTPPPARPDGTPGSGSWWSPVRDGRGSEEKGAAAAGGRSGSPVEGVVQQRAPAASAPPALLMLPPPPREVARPEMRSTLPPAAPAAGRMDEEEWVTVYGFFPGDTNLVLREFEKCGVILKHVPGPRDANWMHILYQSRYDAQKALGKNGVQLNSALIVGVKPVDPVQRQYLNERLNSSSGSAHGGFMVSSHPQLAGRTSAAPALASVRPDYQPNGGTDARDKGQRTTSAIASPAKSVVSKMIDLMFGL